MYGRMMSIAALAIFASVSASRASVQRQAAPAALPPGQTNDPFPQPIVANEGVITVVTLREFATLPDITECLRAR